MGDDTEGPPDEQWAPLDPDAEAPARPSAPPPGHGPPRHGPPSQGVPPGMPPPQGPPSGHGPPPGWGPPPQAPPPGWGPPPGMPPPQGPPSGYGPPPGHAPPPPGYPPPAGYGVGGSARTGPLPLHPMTVGDILDGAFKLLRANARTIVVIVAAFMVPLHLLAAFAQREVLGDIGAFATFGDPSVTESAAQSTADAALAGVSTLLSIIVLPFLAGAIAKVVGASYLGEQLDAGPALRAALRRWWALFASWVVVHLLEVSGFIVGGIILVLAAVGGGSPGGFVVGALAMLVLGLPVLVGVMGLSVAVAPAIVIEELGPIRGVRRSWQLTRRRFFPVLGIALLAGLITTILGQVLETVPSLVAVAVGDDLGWLILAAGLVLSSLVTAPIVAIVATLLYFDLRIRTEGFDLQVMAAELSTGDGR